MVFLDGMMPKQTHYSTCQIYEVQKKLVIPAFAGIQKTSVLPER